jgi:hypothetical protein
MQRFNSFPVYNGNRELELGPYDLILLNQNGRQVLVAAAGREGLLIKSGESNWKRQGVFGAGPTPYKTDDFWKALEIIINEIISYSLAAFIFVFLHVIVNAKKHDNKVFIILMTASILAILSPSMVFLYSKFLYSRHIGSFFFSDLYFSIISPVGNLVFWISTMIAMVLLLHQLITNTYHSSIGLGVIIIIWGISWILFVLWAFSIIQTYETAAAIAISLNGAFLVWLLYQLIQRVLKKGASTPVLDNKKT